MRPAQSATVSAVFSVRSPVSRGSPIIPVAPHTLRTITGLMNRVVPRWPMTPQWFDILAGNRTAKLGNLYDYCGVRPVRFEDTLLTYMPQRRYLPELARFMWRRSY